VEKEEGSDSTEAVYEDDGLQTWRVFVSCEEDGFVEPMCALVKVDSGDKTHPFVKGCRMFHEFLLGLAEGGVRHDSFVSGDWCVYSEKPCTLEVFYKQLGRMSAESLGKAHRLPKDHCTEAWLEKGGHFEACPIDMGLLWLKYVRACQKDLGFVVSQVAVASSAVFNVLVDATQ